MSGEALTDPDVELLFFQQSRHELRWTAALQAERQALPPGFRALGERSAAGVGLNRSRVGLLWVYAPARSHTLASIPPFRVSPGRPADLSASGDSHRTAGKRPILLLSVLRRCRAFVWFVCCPLLWFRTRSGGMGRRGTQPRAAGFCCVCGILQGFPEEWVSDCVVPSERSQGFPGFPFVTCNLTR